MAEILILLSLAEILQWPSLCKDVREELRIAVEYEIITEREAQQVMDGCRKYEERERKSNK